MIDDKFSATLRYHAVAEPATLLADIAGLREHSETARTMRWVAIFALVTWIIVGFVVGFGVLKDALCFVAIPWGILGAIIFGMIIRHYNRQILDERRRKVAEALIKALACDVTPNGTLQLGIDFNPYEKDKYKLRTLDRGKYSRHNLYRLPWLVVAGKLADGSSLELWVDLVARRKERDKTKGRKKIKEAIEEQISLTIRLPAMTPAIADRWPELVRTAKLASRMYLHRAGCKGRRLSLEVRTHRKTRVTNKGSVEVGKDLESHLADHHCVLRPLLAAWTALIGCRRGL